MFPAWPAGPWQTSERRRLQVGVTLAVVMLAVAWWGADAESETQDQLVFGVVGVLAVGVVAVTVLGWLTYGRRAVGLRMQMLLGQSEMVETPTSTVHAMVSVADTARFHLADCVMVVGKPVETRGRESHEAMGLVGCQMCGTADA